MKKTFLILALILFSCSAFAGSCPMLWAEIDSKIEEIQKELETEKTTASQASWFPEQ